MHYGDPDQIKANKLVIIVYKHGTPRRNVYDYVVTSIHECKYFAPYIVKLLVENPNKYLGKYFKNKKKEKWYKTTIKSIDSIKHFEIVSIEEVFSSKNKFNILH